MGVPVVTQRKMSLTSVHGKAGSIPGLAEAVVWSGGCGSDLAPCLGTSICYGCSPKKIFF